MVQPSCKVFYVFKINPTLPASYCSSQMLYMYVCGEIDLNIFHDTPAEMETTQDEEVKSDSLEAHGSSMDECDPWNPPYPPRRPAPPDLDIFAKTELVSQAVDGHLWHVLPKLVPILDEDSIPKFLDLFNRVDGGLAWGFIITPLTLTQMVKQNALQCAKVALAGKAPKLHGFRANPNCMNRYGYFPLHEAAEMFSVDMIKLLFRYNASANVRTAGAEVIEGLLPLHVAVENTCLHKYLEDNASLSEEDLDNNQANKIFLDTIRLLGEHTDNLMEELWNYIEEGSLVQSAVLLLATQKQIRRCLSCSRNGKSKLDGFHVIINRILNYIISLENGQTGKEELKVPYVVQIPRNEMIHHVKSILRNNGVCPSGGDIDLGNLSRYDRILLEVLPIKCGDNVVKAAAGSLGPHSTTEKVETNEMPRGWELEYARISYFPFWRSVLKSKSPVKVFPAAHFPTLEEIRNSRNKPASEVSPLIQDLNLGVVERFKKFSNQHRRMFSSVAFPLLKVLRKA
ncbi:hypothetical protein PR202_gb15490 [Eleusine coracana subsp. coracana]|uniref:Uncharacterized protein n=1 Tax=Eleusine coracana subsp. coracana TaxID=191504 RepID=A0AAV5EY50_ELECO|nr:hypothetical protein PR202_gb15490 [Eleusine coracana subsp. coracana]